MDQSFRSSLAIEGLEKRYGAVAALDGVSLTVGAGEFLTLLGPSGSGKTTLLMAIAGFVAPSAGTIRLDDAPILHLPPERRNFGMVFQGYALFPHMSVAKNVAFPLEVRGRPRAEVEGAVRGALELVRLGHLAERLPRQLSGGQQQRVALARALVFQPHLLLLDEPLSALDRKLRLEVQLELKTLHREVGRTFIYVTHDQDEALSLSDRIAIMRDGRIVQAGAPRDLYDRPRTRYVADFLGRSNFVAGAVEGVAGGEAALRAGPWRIRQSVAPEAERPAGRATLALRPERVRVLAPGEEAANAVTGRVANWSYFGTQYHLVVDVDGLGEIALSAPAASGPPPGIGEPIAIGWEAGGGTFVVDDSQPALAA
jgi:putative spermidine/putrescine transport system ATP-binding protein